MRDWEVKEGGGGGGEEMPRRLEDGTEAVEGGEDAFGGGVLGDADGAGDGGEGLVFEVAADEEFAVGRGEGEAGFVETFDFRWVCWRGGGDEGGGFSAAVRSVFFAADRAARR